MDGCVNGACVLGLPGYCSVNIPFRKGGLLHLYYMSQLQLNSQDESISTEDILNIASTDTLQIKSWFPVAPSVALDADNVDFSGLECLVHLKTLEITSRGLVDISGLAPLKQLQVIHLSGNDISDFSVIVNMPHLYEVVMYDNNIVDLTPVVDFAQHQNTACREADVGVGYHLDGNPIQNLDVLANTSLSKLGNWVFLNNLGSFNCPGGLQNFSVVQSKFSSVQTDVCE